MRLRKSEYYDWVSSQPHCTARQRAQGTADAHPARALLLSPLEARLHVRSARALSALNNLPTVAPHTKNPFPRERSACNLLRSEGGARRTVLVGYSGGIAHHFPRPKRFRLFSRCGVLGELVRRMMMTTTISISVEYSWNIDGSYGMLKVEYSRNIPGNIDGSFGIYKGEYGHSPAGKVHIGQLGVPQLHHHACAETIRMHRESEPKRNPVPIGCMARVQN